MILDLRGNCKAGQDRPHVKVFASLFQKAAGDKRGRRPLLCGAARGAVRNAQQIKNAQQKRPRQPKTAKRFFGGPDSQGPSGQAKERTRILPVRRGFSAPGAPRRLTGLAVLARAAAVVVAFVSGALAFFCRSSAALFPACAPPAAFVPGPVCAASCCFCLCPALPGLACRLRSFALSFFCPFLPNFFLSKFFSLVAQAATGLYFLPKRK